MKHLKLSHGIWTKQRRHKCGCIWSIHIIYVISSGFSCLHTQLSFLLFINIFYNLKLIFWFGETNFSNFMFY